MPAWKHHVFVCTNTRPPGHPKGSCGERGCAQVAAAFSAALDVDDELMETVKLQTSNCLGPCRAGPTVVVYPEGVWYRGLTAADVPEIIREHFHNGRPVKRLLLEDV
ncbi:ferredoxin [Deltaproteobacteria bacterium]|nr:ferredoxin [Deltaproteobacteria bacterium]